MREGRRAEGPKGRRARRFLTAIVASAVILTAVHVAGAQPAAKAAIPARFTDAEFWKFIVDNSEPEGSFTSENLLSNETGYQMVIPALLKAPRTNRIYLGVGPEQNFTYINALKPKMAVIFDIRRGNLLGHLLYKALFELSTDRADFVSRLFGKPRPKGLDSTSSASAIMAAYWDVWGDSTLYEKNYRDITEQLLRKHGFALSAQDTSRMWWIYNQFYSNGLTLTYTSNNGRNGPSGMPNYREITTATDGLGHNLGFLGSEANFRYIKDLETKNLIIPVVGNFGGRTAIKSVGAWLKEHDGVVAAFYASNVEQYLFQDGIAWNYYDNVSTLPIDSNSVIIRSVGGGRGMNFYGGSGMRGPNLMCPIRRLLEANAAGRIGQYGDIFNYCE